jgi:hypothetical protein
MSAKDRFEQLIQQTMQGRRVGRGRATSIVIKANPQLHREFLADHNEQHGNHCAAQKLRQPIQ